MSTLFTLFKSLNCLKLLFIPVGDLKNLNPHKMSIREQDDVPSLPRRKSTVQDLDHEASLNDETL